MKTDLNKEFKGKNISSKANIVSETYDLIMDEKDTKKKNSDEVTDIEIEQANELINPDPNTLDRG